MQISLNSDFPDLINNIRQLPEKIQKKVLVPALKDVSKLGRTQAIRSIGQEFNLDRPTISSAFSIKVSKDPSFSVNGIAYQATLTASSGRKRAFNIIRFLEKKITLAQSRKRRKSGSQSQLHVKVLKSGGFKSLGKNAFIFKNGKTVFRRIPNSKKIEPISTIGISQMFSTRRLKEPTVFKMKSSLLRYIQYSLDRYLKNIKGA
jgi:hypothetical protein